MEREIKRLAAGLYSVNGVIVAFWFGSEEKTAAAQDLTWSLGDFNQAMWFVEDLVQTSRQEYVEVFAPKEGM